LIQIYYLRKKRIRYHFWYLYNYSGTCVIRHFQHPVTSDKKLWFQSISEYYDILYNPTHFPGPFMSRMRPGSTVQ
jgi:hypothetical protein